MDKVAQTAAVARLSTLSISYFHIFRIIWKASQGHQGLALALALGIISKIERHIIGKTLATDSRAAPAAVALKWQKQSK